MWEVGDFRLKRSGKSIWGKSGKSVGVRGTAESNFIINCNFSFFVVAEVTQILRFLNEYEELETVEPGYWVTAFRE